MKIELIETVNTSKGGYFFDVIQDAGLVKSFPYNVKRPYTEKGKITREDALRDAKECYDNLKINQTKTIVLFSETV